jgi:transmembrane sensor
MKEKKFRKLLKRYSRHESDAHENLLIERWYDSFDKDTGETSLFKDQNRRRELRNSMHAAIHAKIDLPVRDKSNSHYFSYWKIAASILLVGGAGLWFWYNTGLQSKPETQIPAYVRTGPEKMKKLILPDSSEIWLNSASTLHYNKDFNHGKERVVSLDQGEAFFKVRHNPNRPFIVQAGGVSTRVLGTSFNIRSYREIDEIRVTVLTGKVQVNSQSKLLGLLLPGQQVVYNKRTDRDSVLSINPEQSNSWIDGKTYLRQASFAELALTLKNRYGIVLRAGNTKVEKLRFSMQLDQHTPVEYTIKAICSIHQTKHRRRAGNEIELY